MDSVRRCDIEEIRRLHNPPKLVQKTLEAMFLLLGYSTAQASVSISHG
jgi:hypothetical protein